MIQTKTLKEALKDPGVIEVVGELIPEATSTNKGLMPAKYRSYYPIFDWGLLSNKSLIKIGRMEKQRSAVYPLGMLIWERHSAGATSFYTFSIINRAEGIYNGIKNIGPGQRKCKFYYKEEGNMLSLYMLQPTYITAQVVFAFMDGLENKRFLNEPQENTDTSGLIEITE